MVPIESHVDEYGTNAALYTEIEFDFLDEEIVDSESAFSSFTTFVDEHHSAFDEKTKKLCLHVAEELAAAYRGTNKKEKKLLESLKRKLRKVK